MRALTLLVLLALGCGTAANASECRALIIAGDAGDDAAWAGNFARWSAGWQLALTSRCHVPAANIRALTCPPVVDRAVADQATVPTRANAIAALEAFAKSCAPGDQAIVVLIGHGYQSEGVGKLCLPGDDLADADVARALKGMKATSAALLVLAPEGAVWAKALAGPGRAVVVANVKQSAPYFGEFLLRELTPDATLFDAFNRASLATIAWYQNQFETQKTHVVTVHGATNQEIFRLVYPGKEFTPGDEQPRAAVNDINQHAAFDGRRVLAEVAGLDDDGDGKPATIFDQGTEPKPVGSPPAANADAKDAGDDGKLARALVLGRP